ncbi:conserved protein of unknown function [Methanocaldococcus lauensis]|uniref:Uncharacterized protein n=1 Tax=Methanocaldococcus lauensis TaxID=2546128 RepID=A0A8D6PU30_9EURY|nr:DUF2334 domain-containing protein [Methanocaldococcus lauensis]CAB3287271.1 conserved protein of unknown function [Methanocaldococcus lauensis]
MRILFQLIIILFIVLLPSFPTNTNYNYTLSKQNKPIILIHDVSPVYFKDLKKIVKIINKYHYQNRTYLFLIVNHANEHNLKNYPEFVKYLHQLEKEGYHIEYHAYNHIGDEFNCNKTVAEEKLNKSFKILKECGFNPKKIKYFIPPRYRISKDAEKLFLERNISIILNNKIITKNNGKIYVISIINREYTWYLPKIFVKDAEIIALIDYKLSKIENKPYFLSIHPKAVNYGGGLLFLNDFLNETLRN